MNHYGVSPSNYGLENHGLTACRNVYWNLAAPEIYEHSLKRGEGWLAQNGALVVSTGKRTGRSPLDKFVVDEPSSRADIAWGSVNRPMSEETFDKLHKLVLDHCRDLDVYVRDCFVGADEKYRVAIRVITETAWRNYFAATMFVEGKPAELRKHTPEWLVLNVPSCQAKPEIHGTHSEAFIVMHFGKKLVLIGGTGYAGEIKKSMFTMMNYLLPKRGVFSMHCSANIGKDNDTTLFFGLSGTGKTTLSADSERSLIGDDEHGWSDDGVFNIEGGCYAKCIRLSPIYEPQIYKAVCFGSILENVVMDPGTRAIDFDSDHLTENTRAAYPIEFIENAVIPSVGPHPKNIIFLTCDAFGVLPPISKLTPEQAMYHFLSGYTAKIAGTEAGVTEPKATFSTCFGAPFLPLAPTVYANMLGDKMQKHKAQCWLLNTGWSGGGYGTGQRMRIDHTRAMVRAALDGSLRDAKFTPDPIFGVGVPTSCASVPADVLAPRKTWADAAAYDRKAAELATLFANNFKNFGGVSREIAAAGPRVGS